MNDTDSIAVVIDTSTLFQIFNFLCWLGKNTKIIIPRAVWEEVQNRGDDYALDKLKRLKNIRREEQNSEIKKRAKTLTIGLKRFPELREKVRSEEWLVRGSYGTHLFWRVKKAALEAGICGLSNTDLRVLATCLNLEENGLNENGASNQVKVKLLTYDRGMRRLARRLGIELPCFHGCERKFDINEILEKEVLP